MPKTTRDSYKVGLVLAVTAALFSEFWDWFIYVAFPNRPQEISAPALYFVDSSSRSFGMSEIWLLIIFLINILVSALFVSWLMNWLGEETHTGPGAGWRWILLGFLFSFLEFSDIVPDIRFLVWGVGLVAYWLLFRKLGLNRLPAAT